MAFNGFPKDLRPNLREFCRSSLCIMVGERDSEQGAFRKDFRGYDLDCIQGSGRKERAENWVDIMRGCASKQGYTSRIKIKIVRQAAHKINNRIINCAEQFFRENVKDISYNKDTQAFMDYYYDKRGFRRKMEKVTKGFILPSAALTIKQKQVKYYKRMDKTPEQGDVVYGKIIRIGQHSSLENAYGRIHLIHRGTRAVFVFGNRYAPDYYEGLLPEKIKDEVDLLARSGLIGLVKTKSPLVKDPTRVKILGYICDKDGEILNTKNFSLIQPKKSLKTLPRSPMILVCGTSMNSGKSMAAVACCRILSSLGYSVRASKVTGTANLKDILYRNDAGASHYSDFSHFGYPSTYLLPEWEVLSIFNRLDLKYANNPKNYWVVEFADGILQRETSLLLKSDDVKSRIHRFIFCAVDAFGMIGGLRILKERYELAPDALSGVCSSSPLYIRELSEFTDIPLFNSADENIDHLAKLLIPPPTSSKKSREKSLMAVSNI
jgi:hypothetical protein